MCLTALATCAWVWSRNEIHLIFNVSRHLLKTGVLPDSLLEMSGLLIITKSLGVTIDTDEH